MTAKDYRLIALAVRTARTEHLNCTVEDVVNELRLALGADNKRFDGVKFTKACEVQYENK